MNADHWWHKISLPEKLIFIGSFLFFLANFLLFLLTQGLLPLWLSVLGGVVLACLMFRIAILHGTKKNRSLDQWKE